MIFLAVFCSMAEKRFGRKTLLIYIASGMISSFVSFLYPVIVGGASGAIFGLLGANLTQGNRKALIYGLIFLVLARNSLIPHLAGFLSGFAAGYLIKGP
jgi:membrane associated rhomboid family serine protease